MNQPDPRFLPLAPPNVSCDAYDYLNFVLDPKNGLIEEEDENGYPEQQADPRNEN